MTWNDAATHLLGYRLNEVLGQNFGELFFPPERQGNIKAFVRKLFDEDSATTIDVPLVTRALQRIPVRFYVTPILTDERKPSRIAIIITENYAEPERGANSNNSNVQNIARKNY